VKVRRIVKGARRLVAEVRAVWVKTQPTSQIRQKKSKQMVEENILDP